MLKATVNAAKASVRSKSNRLGTFLLFAGGVPFVLYVLDYVDVIRPGERPEAWGLIVIAVAAIGLGMLLLKGKGDSVGDAFTSWFKSKSG